jgi:hypothetical protein
VGERVDLGDYAPLRDAGAFLASDEPAFVGVSGGRTSALLAALVDPAAVLCFENTGQEDARTLEFLMRLSDALRREIVWLEFRPPMYKGAPPREFGFAVVTPATATRGGALFEALFQALAEYRETKGAPPLAPGPRQRLCTAYLKHRVQRAYMRSLGVGDDVEHDEFVGLRADEPARVSRLKARDTRARTFRTPLAEMGITKADVNRFWARQSFDLELEHDRQGNCGACFLKDHADISRVLGDQGVDAAWWIDMSRRYPGFGGRNFPGYAQLLKERPVRLAVEADIKAGRAPVSDGTLADRRFKLVVINERRYLRGEREAFSCACEGSVALADQDEAA